ncbi:MAG TPA: neutral zinc metallopeptidase [Mycobacterium sp.]|nr:neutral zinc metallopeptidase [Mycobacterium sp.]
MRRLLSAAAVAFSAMLAVSGCTHLLTGKPVSIFADPFRVAGLPATDGPSGLRPDAAPPTRKVEGGNGGEEDKIAVAAVSDIEEFWKGAYKPLDGEFQPASAVVSWDSTEYDGEFCHHDTYDLVNAMYCWDDNNIGWDRGQLFPMLRKAFGDMAIPLVLGHEYGHAIQRRALLAGPATPSLVAEQQADCFAGVYMRWVAEGDSPRFTLSTSDGLNSVLAAVISTRDPVQTQGDSDSDEDEHGSAFERISAFQMGFTDGTSACAGIDKNEVKQRRGDLPIALTGSSNGEWPVTEQSVRAIVDAMNKTFSPAHPPALTFDTSGAASCSDAHPSPPVSYCPTSNTIAVDLPGLEKMGTPTGQRRRLVLPVGDNTAYSVLVSRYTLALEKQRGAELDNAAAALRTACLTGVATTKMSQQISVDGQTVQLAAGDLDEAVSGMLTNGLAASDVNGESVPSGFSRIDAFRAGVLGDQDRCFKRFP